MTNPDERRSEDDWGSSTPWQEQAQPPPHTSAHGAAPSPPPTGPHRSPEQGAGRPPVNIPNYLVPAILVTLLCCLPTGIAALVYAAQVNSKVAAGDIAGARQSSNQARTWVIVSVVVGVVVWFFALASGAV